MEALKALDTDVFIDHFRGLAAAIAYIRSLIVYKRTPDSAERICTIALEVNTCPPWNRK